MLNKTNHEIFLFSRQRHPFHILGASLYPHLTGAALFLWLVPLTFYIHGISIPYFSPLVVIHVGLFFLFLIVMDWFISIVKEAAEGDHTRKVQGGLRIGMLLFILSEVIFFFAFFWAFFHCGLAPSIAIGAVWPPTGTQELDVWGLPLVNTLLLLTSGVAITIAHAYMLRNNHRGFKWYLLLTILFGIIFLYCQSYEYTCGTKFSWRDTIYGSIFFITTGFHGLHVTIGTLFLAFCWVRHYITLIVQDYTVNKTPFYELWPSGILRFRDHYSRKSAITANFHFGFEAAAWYWHFVDVVWLFLFLTVYWWGGV